MGWIFRWHTLGPSAPPEHRFNSTTYPSVVADRGLSVASSAGCFQDSIHISHHLRRFLELDNEFAVLRRPPQSTEVERQLHIIYNCVMVSCQHGSECQRNVCSTSVNLCHEGLKRLLKEGPTWYQLGVPNKVAYKHIHKNEKRVNISHNSWYELCWWRSCCELRFSASLRIKRVGRLHCSCKARCTCTST